MPAPLPPWSNSAFRWALAVCGALAFGIPLALMAWMRTPYSTTQTQMRQQPVEFDHRHHVADDLIDCRYCHTSAETTPYAGVPATETCMHCHNQIWNDSPLLEPVRRSYFEGEPIAWERVHRLADFVFFDHSVHVANGVACESCHGRVDRMARVYQVAPLTMGWCLDCHRDPLPHLRPPDAITAMGWQPPEPERARLGRALAALYDVNPGTDCTACHR